MLYSGTRLKEEVSVKELVSVHYFEFSKDCQFACGRRDFCELIYVDKGELSVETEKGTEKLKNGQIAICSPDEEWHMRFTDGVSAPYIAWISFKTNSVSLQSLGGKNFRMGNRQRTLISHILEESVKAFETPLDNICAKKLIRREAAPIGAEQLIKNYISELLISILRDEAMPDVTAIRQNFGRELFSETIRYMEDRINGKICLDDIARFAGISKTAVKQLFKEKAGCGACQFFTRMKIERAKEYIREGNFNFTEIAELLGYDSIHYFSRQFKNYVKMSPTEYSGSIRALTNDGLVFGKEEDER